MSSPAGAAAPPQQHFDPPGPVRLELSLGAGRASVVAGTETGSETGAQTADARACAVWVEPCDPYDADAVALASQVLVRLLGDRLEVAVPTRGFRRHPAIHVHARVPTGSSLSVGTGSSSVDVDGPIAALRVTTGSGDITAAQVTGDVQVTSGSGRTHIGDVGGSLRLRGASGDMTVGVVGGQITVRTASADVRIGGARGDVEVTSASGSVALQCVGRGRVRVQTASGDVRVGVRAGTPVHFDLTSASGLITSTLEQAAGPASGEQLLELRARTASGRILLSRS